MTEFLYYDRTTIESWMRDTLDRAQAWARTDVFDDELGKMAYAAYSPRTVARAANLAALHVLYAGPMTRLQTWMGRHLGRHDPADGRLLHTELWQLATEAVDTAQVGQYAPDVIGELVASFRQCDLGQLQAYQANEEAGEDLQIAARFMADARARVDQEIALKPELTTLPPRALRHPPDMPVQTVQLGAATL